MVCFLRRHREPEMADFCRSFFLKDCYGFARFDPDVVTITTVARVTQASPGLVIKQVRQRVDRELREGKRTGEDNDQGARQVPHDL